MTLALAACGAMSADRGATQRIAVSATSLTPEGFTRLQRGMSGATLRLAARFDPAAHGDAWDRPLGWTSLSLATSPPFPFGQLTNTDAAALNAVLPIDDADFAPAQPFFLRASPPERARALLCMTQAIYYEAALEPTQGQQAVAQTVINRVRHPDFPKSVCGVVYEGSQLPIGCQFSFTCDGSLARPPIEPYWSRAKFVAEAALDGFVAKDVGSATHYHADYVFPRWGPQMVKIVQLGAHIFYRYPGPAGAPQVLTGAYAGRELAVLLVSPAQAAIQAANAAQNAQLAAQLAAAPAQSIAAVTGGRPMLLIPPAAPGAPDATMAGADARAVVVPGRYVFGRRIPTREEIAKINAMLPPTPVDDTPVVTAGGDGR
ncbi:MAG TPA: cell wall hydrolase [Caulobacteraceae bacterium]|nr:cell wall hydrolase [Caulobacteraceae bacterium]